MEHLGVISKHNPRGQCRTIQSGYVFILSQNDKQVLKKILTYTTSDNIWIHLFIGLFGLLELPTLTQWLLNNKPFLNAIWRVGIQLDSSNLLIAKFMALFACRGQHWNKLFSFEPTLTWEWRRKVWNTGAGGRTTLTTSLDTNLAPPKAQSALLTLYQLPT